MTFFTTSARPFIYGSRFNFIDPSMFDIMLVDNDHTKNVHCGRQKTFTNGNEEQQKKVNQTKSLKYNDFKYTMDLPGVKVDDLNITLEQNVLNIQSQRRYLSSDGTTRKKSMISHAMYLDERKIDVTDLKANLSDGVLIISAPGKSKAVKPTVVPVDTIDHDDFIGNNSMDTTDGNDDKEKDNGNKDRDENNKFWFNMDMPGVKVKDLSVEFDHHHGVLEVIGYRHHQNKKNTKVFSRSTLIDETDVDTSQLRGNLSDGVLTVVAPRKNNNVAGGRVVLVVPVSEVDHDEFLETNEDSNIDETTTLTNNDEKVAEKKEVHHDGAATANDGIPPSDSTNEKNVMETSHPTAEKASSPDEAKKDGE